MKSTLSLLLLATVAAAAYLPNSLNLVEPKKVGSVYLISLDQEDNGLESNEVDQQPKLMYGIPRQNLHLVSKYWSK